MARRLALNSETAPRSSNLIQTLFGRFAGPSAPSWSLEKYLQILLLATALQVFLHFLVFADRFSPVLPPFLGEMNQLTGSEWLKDLWSSTSSSERWQVFLSLQFTKLISVIGLWLSLRGKFGMRPFRGPLFVFLLGSSLTNMLLCAPMLNAGDRLLWLLWVLSSPFFFFFSRRLAAGNVDSRSDWPYRLSIDLLQAQSVLLYLGATISKLTDESWQNGYAPALSLVSPASSNPLFPIGPWMVGLSAAPMLMKLIAYAIILSEACIALGLLNRRTRSLAIAVGFALHFTLIFTHSVFFVQVASMLALLTWFIKAPSASDVAQSVELTSAKALNKGNTTSGLSSIFTWP